MNTPAQALDRIHDPVIVNVYVTQVLAIIPTADREFVTQLIREHITPHGERSVELVLELLLEGEQVQTKIEKELGPKKNEKKPEVLGTPRVKAEKRKREEVKDEEEELGRVNKGKAKFTDDIDYTSEYRENIGGPNYTHWAKRQLYYEHPHLLQKHIDVALKARKGLYAPTDLHLTQDWNSRTNDEQKEIMRSGSWYKPPKNLPILVPDEEFEREKEWLILYKQDMEKERVKVAQKDIEEKVVQRLRGDIDTPPMEERAVVKKEEKPQVVEARVKTEEPVVRVKPEPRRVKTEEPVHAVKNEEAGGLNCMACTVEKDLEELAQCSDAHLFCKTCFCDHASSFIDRRERNIPCVLTPTCNAPILIEELERVLPPYLLAAYRGLEPFQGPDDHPKREEEPVDITALDLGGLNVEKCPFCAYAAFVEEDLSEEGGDRRFWCQAEDCGRVSCRDCKGEAHNGLTCDGQPVYTPAASSSSAMAMDAAALDQSNAGAFQNRTNIASSSSSSSSSAPVLRASSQPPNANASTSSSSSSRILQQMDTAFGTPARARVKADPDRFVPSMALSGTSYAGVSTPNRATPSAARRYPSAFPTPPPSAQRGSSSNGYVKREYE